MPGLIKAVDGNAAFIAKLDGLFVAKLYDQDNEPSHGIAYLYKYAGALWKAQMRVREVLASQFHTGPEVCRATTMLGRCLPGTC
jgi:putative alpha-1,2-mannosidase